MIGIQKTFKYTYAYFVYKMLKKTVSIRISENTEKDLEAVETTEKVSKSAALRKIIDMGLQQWKRERALTLLREEKISFNKAAEMAEVSVWELADILEKKGIQWVAEKHSL